MLVYMPLVQPFLIFQNVHNTWVPILHIFPFLWNFFWVSFSYKHHLLPGTLVEFFLSRANFFSYIGIPSSYVVLVSLLVPYLSILQVLILTYRFNFSNKLEHYIFIHTIFQMDLI